MEQGVRELEAFAAVVYSSNFDLQTPGFGPDATVTAAARAPPAVGIAPSVSPSPSPAAEATNADARSIEEVNEEELQEVPAVSLQDNEEPLQEVPQVQEIQEEENEKAKEEINLAEAKQDVGKEDITATTPVVEETTGIADSGFEEVWGKASSGVEAEPSSSS